MNKPVKTVEKIERGPLSVREFAWRVAGPRDFVISLIVNTTIAFWVFRRHDSVPLTGGHSVASVVLPMSFLLCTLTTFFGWFNVIRERRLGNVVPPLIDDLRWAWHAWRNALIVGISSLVSAQLIFILVRRQYAEVTIAPYFAVLAIGVGAGLMGFLLHGLAVVRGGALGVPLNNDSTLALTSSVRIASILHSEKKDS